MTFVQRTLALLALLISTQDLSAGSALAQTAAPTGRNACFIRIQALRTIPGLAAAVPHGEAINQAAGAANLPSLLQAYDRVLANAIAAWGSTPETALHLLDAESLVFRIAECHTQLGLGPNMAAAAAEALDDGFRRNASHYTMQAPSQIDDRGDRRLQERMLASGRLASALARLGRADERQNAIDREAQLIAQAEAEAEARWEAGRPQREAEERARWAAANAAERRQLTAEATPDQRLITRAILNEFREVGQTMTSLTFARAISELTTRPGDRAGFNEHYNYESGDVTLSFGQGAYAMTQFYRFWPRNVSCTRRAGSQPAFMCNTTVQASANVLLAGATILDLQGDEVPLSLPLEWNGTRWSLPTVRAAMSRGLQQSAVASTSRSVGDPNDSLCSSLYAGVVGAGGTSTSAALNPQTWGC